MLKTKESLVRGSSGS